MLTSKKMLKTFKKSMMSIKMQNKINPRPDDLKDFSFSLSMSDPSFRVPNLFCLNYVKTSTGI